MKEDPSSLQPAARPTVAALRSRLRYVRLTRDDVRWDLFPDFFIAGPQRTGTSWLYYNLILHPEVMLTVPKELFYWSTLKQPASPRFVSADLDSYLSRFEEPIERRTEKNERCMRLLDTPYRPRVRGEATASNAALDPDVIDDICALNPAIKVILMVRHPVERAWSHAKKDLARKLGRPVEAVPASELEEFFTQPYQLRCARFYECIANWRSRLRPGHLFVGRFQDLRLRPLELLLDVMRFLDVRADPRHGAARGHEAINVTSSEPIPERHRRFLEDLLAREIAEFERGF